MNSEQIIAEYIYDCERERADFIEALAEQGIEPADHESVIRVNHVYAHALIVLGRYLQPTEEELATIRRGSRHLKSVA